ncbi:MAG: hypothetical protein MR727_00340 [Lentisphaeria bacterium]|nr:hypothetical protein [Lentisphaeria bacterium]
MSDEILQKTITTVKDFKNCIDKLDDALEDAGADASLRTKLLMLLEDHTDRNVDAAAAKNFRNAWIKTGNLHAKHVFSEHEIYMFMKNRNKTLKMLAKFRKISQNIDAAKKIIRKWRCRITVAKGLITLTGGRDSNSSRTIEEFRNDMWEAKNKMDRIVKAAKAINEFNLPFVRDMIDLYLDFFLNINGICKFIDDYGKNLIVMVEILKKDSYNAMHEKNSVRNQLFEAISRMNRGREPFKY